jgi:hypothetical protein
MAATQDMIRDWLKEAKEEGATHVIVVCDTYDHEDYPVQVMPGVDPKAVYERYNGKEMQRVMEVYALHLDFESQLNERRAFHLEGKPS